MSGKETERKTERPEIVEDMSEKGNGSAKERESVNINQSTSKEGQSVQKEEKTLSREDARKDTSSLLKEAIRDQATEDERPNSASLTLRKILGGDFLTTRILRNQIWLIVIIAVFTLVYVSNRYSCQRDIREINELKEKLKDAKYKSLASSSELTEMCRESNVLKMLKNSGDSILQTPNQPPYIIIVPKDE
ncbi:MAG: hypothetical protein LUC88_05135 [Prevotella sp.]|nr:hypothetical protein [Prevotella sp.]